MSRLGDLAGSPLASCIARVRGGGVVEGRGPV